MPGGLVRPDAAEQNGAMDQKQSKTALRQAFPGFGVALGAGVGIVLGVAIAGGPGIATGAVVGAGVGLVVGAVVYSVSKPRGPQQ